MFGTALLIIVGSLWYTNLLVRQIAQDERMNIRVWAEAIQRKASLVNYTKAFFDQIKLEEQKRAELLAEAYRNFRWEEDSRTLEFYRQLMEKNTTIPIILTDENDVITTYKNIPEEIMNGITVMNDSLKAEFSSFDPIKIVYFENEFVLLYFKESRIFTELRMVLNDLLESFFSEIVGNSASVPVLVTDSTRTRIIESGNIAPSKLREPERLSSLIDRMSSENEPIIIHLPDYGKSYIYYMDSVLLRQIMFYPYIMLVVISVFLFISYVLFSSARKSEQNLVWIGMSKETAHQLGTPLSSIMAWLELLKMKEGNLPELLEMEKDVKRLEDITDRFSKIGSPPKLEPEDLVEVLNESIDYMKPRTSSKVHFETNIPTDQALIVPLNRHLFTWVVENICKNAVDAMNGNGRLTVSLTENEHDLWIDFEDTGKGIAKSDFKNIFNPGFTSKKRGWGLGLSLSRRIIQNYHKGKIFVKSSNIDKGTTIRIQLKKEP